MMLDAHAADVPRDTGMTTQPTQLPSPGDGIDVYFFDLARSADELAVLRVTLSPGEQMRADRFGMPSLRDRYIAGRATLRQILGARLGMPPEQIDIRRGHRGRPHVVSAVNVDFNVSHTGGTALIGLTSQGRIGVDIEHEGRTLNVDGVARKFMAPHEQAMLAGLEFDHRRRTLLRLWTCKEAMSKATGDALSAPFRRMEVTLDDTSAHVRDGPSPYTPDAWTLHTIRAPGDHLATIALWQEL
ncbi:MAG: 4'-phosphopantetheinyl transferase superfamily protein [Betaproteobacteria bacterium]